MSQMSLLLDDENDISDVVVVDNGDDDGQLFQSLTATTTARDNNDAQAHGDQVIAEEVKDSPLMIPQRSNDSHDNSDDSVFGNEGVRDAPPPAAVVVPRFVRDANDQLILQQNQNLQQQQNSMPPKQKNPRMETFAYLNRPVVEVRIIGLVFLSCLLGAIDTLPLPSEIHRGIVLIDMVFVYIFAIEFFLRWWSAGRFQLRYLSRPLVSIDAIVVILPLILTGLLPMWDYFQMAGMVPHLTLPTWILSSSSSNSALLNLRLLRILKFQRILTDKDTYMNFELALGIRERDVRPYQLQLARVVISIFTLVSVSTGLIYAAEHEVNPGIPDYFTALYFGLTTLTTVGFGDISPLTFQGRLVVCVTILAGVAIIPAQAASLAEAYLDFQKERVEGKKQKNMGRRSPPFPVTSMKDNVLVAETRCDTCGSIHHRTDALFCYSCGNKFPE
jgi:voltage-gated potassium channel